MTISQEEAQRLQREIDSKPRVWRDGAYVRDEDLRRGGLPAVQDISTPDLSEWTIFEGSDSAGLQVRWHEHTKQYRAVVSIQDPDFPGEKGPKYSREFIACDEADAAPVDAYGFINPGAEMARRQIDAAVARRLMDVSMHAAPSDMRQHLRDLEHELMAPYNTWQREQEQSRLRKTQSDQAVTFLLQIDLELLSNEQRAALAALFSLKGKK